MIFHTESTLNSQFCIVFRKVPPSSNKFCQLFNCTPSVILSRCWVLTRLVFANNTTRGWHQHVGWKQEDWPVSLNILYIKELMNNLYRG